ncbi:MAG TPA: fibronectin type III domain-containing protein [Nitrosopumilaceae archaeon]|nr:fibronectin type III domain-containing protein [Nitrosopumilaceae archaeon]
MNKTYLVICSVVIFSLLTSSITQYVNAQISPIPLVSQPPSSLTATVVSSSQIDLSWTAPSGIVGLLSSYKIERSTDGGITWSAIPTNILSTSTTYSDTGLAASTTYTYRVFAVYGAVQSQPSNTASATTPSAATAPQPPTGLTATAASSSQINLSWTVPANNGGSDITGYKIERSTDAGTTWSPIVSNSASKSTAYSDTGLSPSTAYTYRVSAINSAGTSQPSNTASATTPSAATAPQPPTGLTATAASSSQINLSWTAPANNGGSAITGYKIERSNNTGTTWSTLVANTASITTTYSNTGLAAGTPYTYRVSAINSIGTSQPSNTASATTTAKSAGITVSAHRIPAFYWDPCFATKCSAGTGPGASMYFGLYNSSGKVIQTGFADENGYTFSGLNASATYYVYPADCNMCHVSNHDVVFQYWGDNHSTVRPRAATVGASLDAWYSCTNNCAP